MTKKKDNLNGSAHLLARALQGVVTEAVTKGNEILLDEMVAMEGRLNRKIDDTNQRLDETNQRLDDTNQRLDDTNQRLDETNQRLDETNQRLDATNQALDNTNQNMQSQFARQEKMIAEINRKMG